jgi:hypothetical protein
VIDFEIASYAHRMEREKKRYISDGICYECDKKIPGTPAGEFCGMPICEPCVDAWPEL